MADNRRTAERFAQSLRDRDVEGTIALVHEDVVVRYPQSGEVVRGRDNYSAMLSNYPSPPEVNVAEVRGGQQDVQVSSPLPFGVPTITVTGVGDTFIVEGIAEYGDGSIFNVVMILSMRDGKVAEEVSYFAEPFEAPGWRKPYVEA